MTDPSTELIRRTTATDRRLERLESMEFASAREPIWAYIRAIDYLKSWPGVRAVWPNYNQTYINNDYFRLSPNPSAAPTSNRDSTRLFPYSTLDQSNEEFFYNDSSNLWTLDSTTWPADPGVLATIWFRVASHPTQDQGLIAAWDGYSDTRSWRLDIDYSAGNKLRLAVSSNGTAAGTTITLSSAIPTGRWLLAVGRYDPSTSLKAWLFDGDTVETAEDTTSIESGLYNTGTIRGYLGAWREGPGGAYYTLNGDIGLASFTTNLVPASEIVRHHAISRHVYGV